MQMPGFSAAPIVISFLLNAVASPAQEPADAGAIMQRMRALREAHITQPLAATVQSTTVIRILDNASRFDVIKPQTIVREHVGAYYHDPDIGTRIRVTATRGTSPLVGIARGPVENFRMLGEAVEFGRDEIVLLNTSLPSPVDADADRHYTFTVRGTDTRNGVPVHAIDVNARSRLRPGFDGTLWIERETGQLVAMELRPSGSTLIPYVETLSLVMMFAPDASGAYLADSLALRATGVVRFAALGLAETRVELEHYSRLRDRRLNAPMPDSLRLQLEPIVIRDDAADVLESYWASRGMLSASQVETMSSSWATYVDPARALSFSVGGMFEYNRASGPMPTLSAGAAFGPVGANVSGGYAFGPKRPVGEASLAVTLGEASSFTASIRGGAFSQVAVTTTGDRTYPRIMNTLVAATLHQDYYNFLRKDGWNAGIDLGYGKVRLGATYEQSRQFSIDNNAKWSIVTWTSKEFPDNPPITAGSYRSVQVDLAFARVAPFLKLTPIGDDDLRWSITGFHGERVDVDTSFELVEALLSYSIPLWRTGYNPIALTLLAAGGTGTATLPPQYQFRLRTSAATFGKPGGFVAAPKGRYGGTEYFALGAELNLTDLPWRALGLPTLNGRGLEVIIGGGAARYLQAHHTGYEPTGPAWYSEAGIGLSRIPLFITDIIFGRVDVRKGFGALGRFGGNFTFVLPL